jgi:chemotaxis-related protein WspD
MTEQKTLTGRLLDREVTADFLRESTAFVAVKKDVIERGTKSVVVFRIGTEWLALPTEVVQEVTGQGTIRTMPDHRGGILRGLINVRGELLLCVSLSILLGLDPVAIGTASAGTTPSDRLLICKHGEGRLAFQVSEVHGLHRYRPTDLREAPATLTRASKGAYTLGVAPWRERIVGYLDNELMFYALDKALA